MAMQLTGCDDGILRGHVESSPDGKTYLAIEEGDGSCSITVDGKPWSHPLKEAAPIVPGEHTVSSCGKPGIPITIEDGTVFRFDYWGP